MTLQLFELTSRSFAVIYRFCHTDLSADQRPERAQQTETVTHLLVSLSEIRFFVAFFLVFFSDFMPMPILVFHHYPDSSCGGSLAQAESLATTRPSALSASTLSSACLSVISLLREYKMSCSWHAASSELSSSPLASRLVSWVLGPQN